MYHPPRKTASAQVRQVQEGAASDGVHGMPGEEGAVVGGNLVDEPDAGGLGRPGDVGGDPAVRGVEERVAVGGGLDGEYVELPGVCKHCGAIWGSLPTRLPSRVGPDALIRPRALLNDGAPGGRSVIIAESGGCFLCRT